jgi:phage FluMu protein Com
MALFRCGKCGHLREVPNDYLGKSVKCPHCKTANPIYDTVSFVTKVIEQYVEQKNELQKLRKQLSPTEAADATETEPQPLADIDIHNTAEMASQQQYDPIIKWFEKHQIQLDVNQDAVDTTGFFDEVAIQLGDNYDTLQLVSDKIKYIQRKGYTTVKITLSHKSQKQIAVITRFCKELYDYSFVAKYFYQKQDKIIRLTLQTAPKIVNFFNGEWMEWFVFMKLLDFFREKQLSVACLRSLSVQFPNEDNHELDVFFLINGTIPLCIECKTGEFRKDIEKYSILSKRLKLEKTQFLICVVGLSQKQTQGLSSMYDVTFVNEKNFLQQIEQVIA